VWINPQVETEAASRKASVLVKNFTKNEELVFFEKYAEIKESTIHSNVLSLGGEKVITKQEINSYQGTDLLSYLQQNTILRLFICGMMTQKCVEAAARFSADYGFEVVVIGDACAAKNLLFGNDTVLAKYVHLFTLATFENYYRKVMAINEFIGK
jgi:nicotinamidase-related amidase